MTRETAKRRIKGFPLNLQSIAKEDIDERAYVSVEIVPLFELDGGYYQMTVNYKIKLDDGYIYGKASCLDEFVKMHDAAARGEVFSIMYLERSRIIIEIEERDDWYYRKYYYTYGIYTTCIIKNKMYLKYKIGGR